MDVIDAPCDLDKKARTFAAMMRWVLWMMLLLLAGTAAMPQADARVNTAAYTIDSTGIRQQVRVPVHQDMDSLLYSRYGGNMPAIKDAISRPHHSPDHTADFYVLLLLCLILGTIRFSDPHYFAILLRAFRNSSGSRHFKEQIQSATVSNFLMNTFFAVVAGAYIYYAGRLYDTGFQNTYESKYMLLILIGGMMLIYLIKYLVIRFSGWAFRVTPITEQYLFNVFLINKIVGIVLLPFAILLAFAMPQWVAPVVIISLLAVALLLVNRYTRSWEVFGSFFQYSRFHFFTYLCASEILPMAILVKILLRTLA